MCQYAQRTAGIGDITKSGNGVAVNGYGDGFVTVSAIPTHSWAWLVKIGIETLRKT